MSSFGLNSSAYDVYYRNDLGIDRLEFVRGGVSNLFGPGSVAGLINYISKTGAEDPERKVQLECAEEDRTRGDFCGQRPLGELNLFYAFSGYYRYDEGPIDTDLDTEGFQLRGNLKCGSPTAPARSRSTASTSTTRSCSTCPSRSTARPATASPATTARRCSRSRHESDGLGF